MSSATLGYRVHLKRAPFDWCLQFMLLSAPTARADRCSDDLVGMGTVLVMAYSG